MRINFKCTFLSDVVLTSQAATEGFHKSLDFIPGGKFLGIMANSSYHQDNDTATLDLFHNGNVKFGNAYPLLNNEPGFPVPFVWFRDKLKKEDEIYLHHKIKEEDREELRKQSKQLKQERVGFINKQGVLSIKPDQKFAIKSAYDSENRKSKDKNMYGYFSISQGSEFLFSVAIKENAVDPDRVKKGLVGIQKIGRSKSAEYGLVEIEEFNKEPVVNPPLAKGTLLIYANSDLCFIDDYGYGHLDLTPELFGLSSDSAKILWDKCQIKTRVQQSYNGKRKTTNADFIVIQKGSVIVMETNAVDGALHHVGSFQNEGFGSILYNPEFLNSNGITRKVPQPDLKNKKTKKKSIVERGDADDQILAMLTRRSSLKSVDQAIEEKVEAFVHQYAERVFKNCTKSQWGAIRAIAKSTLDEHTLMDILFHEGKQKDEKSRGFLRRGIAAKNWEGKADVLFDFVNKQEENKREVLIKTASKMQKNAK